jgi:hypothetical protein
MPTQIIKKKNEHLEPGKSSFADFILAYFLIKI